MSRIADAPIACQEFVMTALRASAPLAAAFGIELGELGGRLWDSPPEPEALDPYVIVSVASPDDVNTVPLVEVMVRAEVTVLVVGQAEAYELLGPHYRAIHAAIQGQTSVPLNGSGTMLSCRRLRAVAYPETLNGIEYRRLGGTYEVFVQ